MIAYSDILNLLSYMKFDTHTKRWEECMDIPASEG